MYIAAAARSHGRSIEACKVTPAVQRGRHHPLTTAGSLLTSLETWNGPFLGAQVMMISLVSVSLAVPLAIWLWRDAFLARREPLLAFKHLSEAVFIAHLMPSKTWVFPRGYLSFCVQW